jgi:DNA repair photolyase
VLSRSKLADYCINCYVGCQHACVYCYAEYYTKKYTNHTEDWGSFLDVKINAPEVLRKEITRKKRGAVFISSLTDPYLPLESKYELTRKCLEILLKNNFSVCIQTKSSLVLRDLDLLKKFRECEVGFTITTLDDTARKVFEPFSSPVEERLNALRILKENGIKTYVFFGPVLPFISDKNLEEYFTKISRFTDYFYVDKLNIKPGIWSKIENVVKSVYPDLVESWDKIFFQTSNYYRELKEKIKALADKNGIKVIFCY